MTEMLADPSVGVPRPISRRALQTTEPENWQTWSHLVDLAADLTFETDANGRFVHIRPETALGWPAGGLIGQSTALVVGDNGTGAIFNPFCATAEVRRHRTWLRCFDGRLAMMTVSAEPILDRAGRIAGTRGIAVDLSDLDAQTRQFAGRLRQGDVLGHMLSRVGCESHADGMMDAALWTLILAVGAEGAAVIGAVSDDPTLRVLHECGPGASAIMETAAGHLADQGPALLDVDAQDGRRVLTVRCQTRFGTRTGLALWRNADSPAWDRDDAALAAAAVGIVRMILEYEAIQQEMAHQARTDPLTGLLNRRAFIEEMKRHISRLDRSAETGTLMYVDLDGFKAVNDRLGHATGDTVLVHLADMLRKLVRPSDLIARLGGDEFAVWLTGADHMTAAERADQLCRNAGTELSALLPEPVGQLGVSVGIAKRSAASREPVEELIRRADVAMYEVKRGGRGHWRVSLLDDA